MWRIMSLPRNALLSQYGVALSEISALLSSIRAQLRTNTQNLIATPALQGDYWVFETNLNGSPVPLSFEALQQNPELYTYWQQRKAELLQALGPYLSSAQGQGQGASQLNGAHLLQMVLERPEYLFLVNNRDLVLVPFLEQCRVNGQIHVPPVAPAAPAAAAAPRAPAPAAAPAATGAAAGTAPAAGAAGAGRVVVEHRYGMWRWLLFVLLLLSIAFAAWYLWYLLMTGTERAPESQVSTPVQVIVDDTDALKHALSENAYLQQKIELYLQRAKDNAALEQNLALQEKIRARLGQQQENKAQDLARVLREAQALEAKIDDKLKAAATAAAVASEKAAASAAPAAPVGAAAQAKKLPRCEVIIKEGKLPRLVMAVDGSGSMLQPLSDRTFRMAAAQKAALSLAKHIDKNVPIHLLGMQGCPLARDYGTFSGARRGNLNAALAQISPLRSSRPLAVLTPLVSALRAMAGAASDNSETVGILISDGVDTCQGTRNLDLCAVTREIHQQKPNLKIHVVLLGDDAPEAQCVAKITGGKVFYPNNTSELISVLRQAGQTLERVCE